MNFIQKSCAALVALHCSSAAFAGGEGWTSDFAAAKKEAAESGKDLLIDFTGSDWCGWCIKLNDEVFKHEEFKTGVKDKFILVELDYPNDKSKLSEETIKQNEELAKQYGIEGFPTIMLASADGKPYAATGYQADGPEKYVSHLDELRGHKKTRDEAFAAAAKSEGTDKAKALVSALKAMELSDASVANFYGDVVETIKSSDPEDTTGFAKEAAVKERLSQFETQLNALAQSQDFPGALALVDKTLEEGGFDPETTQRMTLTKAMINAQLGKFDEAIQLVDEAKKIAPDSDIAGQLDGFKEQLATAKAAAEQGDAGEAEAPEEE